VTLDSLPLDAPLRARFERLGQEFLARFLGHALERQPDNMDALFERAQVLTELGRHAEALALDRRLVRLMPEEPTNHYNLACSLALVGEREAALAALERAAKLGYLDSAHLASDEHLASLRDEPRFRALVKSLQRD